MNGKRAKGDGAVSGLLPLGVRRQRGLAWSAPRLLVPQHAAIASKQQQLVSGGVKQEEFVRAIIRTSLLAAPPTATGWEV